MRTVLGFMCALLFPCALMAQETTAPNEPAPLTWSVDVVTVYHPFGFDEADQPFRIRGPLLVDHDHLEALLTELSSEKGVLIEVCPLKALPGHVFVFYVEREERKKACRRISIQAEIEQAGESR